MLYLRSRSCCYTKGGGGRGGGLFQEYKRARREECSVCTSSGIEVFFGVILCYLVTKTAICVRCFELGSVRRPIVPYQLLVITWKQICNVGQVYSLSKGILPDPNS